MVKREKIPVLTLSRDATLGEKPTQEELSKQAQRYIEKVRLADGPRFSPGQDPKKYERTERERKDKESEERIEELSHNVWLAQEIFIQLWVDTLDQIVMEHGVPEKDALKAYRINMRRPIHPSEHTNGLAFREAQKAIERILPTDRTDDYEDYIGELFKEAKRRWLLSHEELKDRIEFQPANDHRKPESD